MPLRQCGPPLFPSYSSSLATFPFHVPARVFARRPSTPNLPSAPRKRPPVPACIISVSTPSHGILMNIPTRSKIRKPSRRRAPAQWLRSRLVTQLLAVVGTTLFTLGAIIGHLLGHWFAMEIVIIAAAGVVAIAFIWMRADRRWSLSNLEKGISAEYRVGQVVGLWPHAAELARSRMGSPTRRRRATSTTWSRRHAGCGSSKRRPGRYHERGFPASWTASRRMSTLSKHGHQAFRSAAALCCSSRSRASGTMRPRTERPWLSMTKGACATPFARRRGMMDPLVRSWRAACGRWAKLSNERHRLPLQCGGPDHGRAVDSRSPGDRRHDRYGGRDPQGGAAGGNPRPRHSPRADLVRTEAGSWNGPAPYRHTWGLACGIPRAALRGRGYSTCLLTLH